MLDPLAPLTYKYFNGFPGLGFGLPDKSERLNDKLLVPTGLAARFRE